MKVIAFMLLTFLSIATRAQSDSWVIIHNGRVLLQATGENSGKNVVTIRRSDLNKTDYLIVKYSGVTAKGWVRTIYLAGEKDEEMARHSGNIFRIADSSLKAIFKNRSRVVLYTYTMPADPKLKAAVRIRRIHLCTILIK
jgi:hypothetical protein